MEFGEPVLVQISSGVAHKYKPYYIVPIETLTDPQYRRRPYLVIVDAETGTYYESCAMPSRLANAIRTIDWDELKTEALDWTPDKDSNEDPLPSLGLVQRLASNLSGPFSQTRSEWEPCPECFSRFCPVWIVGDPLVAIITSELTDCWWANAQSGCQICVGRLDCRWMYRPTLATGRFDQDSHPPLTLKR